MTHLKIVCLAVLLLWKFVTVAQDRSVAFEELTFQEALAKAKQNNKLLFVDCYTSWCGPCKMLAREVFTNNEVADYFNAHFISLKVDCEKGEGPRCGSGSACRVTRHCSLSTATVKWSIRLWERVKLPVFLLG